MDNINNKNTDQQNNRQDSDQWENASKDKQSSEGTEKKDRSAANSDFHQGSPKPSTGGYGDQHDEERLKDGKDESDSDNSREERTNQYDFSPDTLRRERSMRYGYNDSNNEIENQRDRSYDDYDRGFQDGMRHASKRYNERYWDSRRENQDRGIGNDYANEGQGYQRYDKGWSNYERNEYESSADWSEKGDVDSRSSRSEPSMQGGYGERSEGRNRNESRDNWNEYDTDRDKWNEERDDPWNDRRYGGTTGSGNINHNKSHGDNGNFEGNNRGTPTRDYLDDSKESQNIRKEDRNSDAQNSADRESTRDRNHYQEMRGLRRSKPERERGDRDREW